MRALALAPPAPRSHVPRPLVQLPQAGFASGMKSIGKGVAGGLLGLVVAPAVGAANEGAIGFAKGVATGELCAKYMPILFTLCIYVHAQQGPALVTRLAALAAIRRAYKSMCIGASILWQNAINLILCPCACHLRHIYAGWDTCNASRADLLSEMHLNTCKLGAILVIIAAHKQTQHLWATSRKLMRTETTHFRVYDGQCLCATRCLHLWSCYTILR